MVETVFLDVHKYKRKFLFFISSSSSSPTVIYSMFEKEFFTMMYQVDDFTAEADFYYTDGYLGYIDVVYPGKHIRNVRDKKDTHNVESINADLRHYIPVLARRSRCFARKIETLYSVVAVFIDAFNRFGLAKYKYRQRKKNGELSFSVVDFL